MLGTTVLPDCRPLLAGPDDLALVFQPIVDLAGATITGYEALARFPGTSGPDVWFAAAAECGLAAELEALAIHKALAAVPGLPENTFLTVNVSPHLLGTAPVQTAFATRPDLHRVVVELTADTPVEDPEELRRETDALRARGARIVTLDRALAGAFAGHIDAQLREQDLETPAELAAALRLGVPLGQGWVLGRPSAEFAPLAPDVVTLLRSHAARVRLTESVAALLRPVTQYLAAEYIEVPAVETPPAVLVGPLGEPLALLLADPRMGETHRAPVSLRVHPSAGIEETLARALTRPEAQRFDPVLCTDPTGAVLGLLRIEDLATSGRPR